MRERYHPNSADARIYQMNSRAARKVHKAEVGLRGVIFSFLKRHIPNSEQYEEIAAYKSRLNKANERRLDPPTPTNSNPQRITTPAIAR